MGQSEYIIELLLPHPWTQEELMMGGVPARGRKAPVPCHEQEVARNSALEEIINAK